MSNTRDNSPELDYYELRRRHEEYKNRARIVPGAERPSAQETPVQPAAAPAEEQAVDVKEHQPQPEFVEIPKKKPIPDDFEEAIEEGYEDFEDFDDFDEEDFDEESEAGDVNPNPFDSFISFFHGVKNNISARRKNKGDELDEDELLDELTDEEIAELEAEEFDEADDFVPVARKNAPRAARIAADDEQPEDRAAEIEDIEDVGGALPRRPVGIETDFDEDDETFSDDDFEDLEEDELPREGGFKKFMSLFVSRIDEEEDAPDEDDEEVEELLDEDEIDALEDEDFEDESEEKPAPKRRGLFGRKKKQAQPEEEEDEFEPLDKMDDFESEFIQSVHSAPKGGQKMDEMKKPAAPETTQQSAAAEVGMTRRERRELAMRLAAEEAARKAAEEERAQAESRAIEPLFADLQPEVKPEVDMAAFEDAPATDILVETTAEEAPVSEELIEEPTREFKPVSMRDVEEAAQKDLFSIEADEADDEDYDDDDEDDEDEIVEKKPRRGLFGRKRARVEEDDEDDYDDDDEDDDYDDDEDDEDEDEVVEKKPRRGLFGRKRARVEEDDEDDEEDEYDEDEDEDDDYDSDDEYDEYDDDEEDDYDDDEDEYDDDDDEPRRSFGHHLLGIIKTVLGIILFLLVVVIALNFHYFITGENAVVTKAHEMLGDSAASDVLCFGYEARELFHVEEAEPEIIPEAEITAEPTALPQPETTVAIPNLDTNGDITVTPVIESAPVVEAAPAVEQVPAAGAIG